MGSFAIVKAKPSRKVRGAKVTGVIEASIGPLAKQCLDESLGLAVGLGRARPGAQVPQPQGLANVVEEVGAIAVAVVGEQALDRDSLGCEPGDSAAQELAAAARVLIGEDFGIGDAGMVIDGHVHELPAGAATSGAPPSSDAMTGLRETAQLLRIQVQQIAGPAPLVAAWWARRLQGALGSQSTTRKHGADGRARNAQLLADAARGLLVETQVGDEITPLGGQSVRPARGARRAIAKALRTTLPKPSQPFVRGTAADSSGRGRFACRPSLLDAANEQRSTGRCGPGILMDVHPGFSLLEVVRLAPNSFSGLARVNNPHRNHN